MLGHHFDGLPGVQQVEHLLAVHLHTRELEACARRQPLEHSQKCPGNDAQLLRRQLRGSWGGKAFCADNSQGFSPW